MQRVVSEALGKQGFSNAIYRQLSADEGACTASRGSVLLAVAELGEPVLDNADSQRLTPLLVFQPGHHDEMLTIGRGAVLGVYRFRQTGMHK